MNALGTTEAGRSGSEKKAMTVLSPPTIVFGKGCVLATRGGVMSGPKPMVSGSLQVEVPPVSDARARIVKVDLAGVL